MAITIYHNPRCSKSRESLSILQQQQVQPHVVKYLEQPPSADELIRIVKLLGVSPRELLRTGEEPYKALGLEDPSLSDKAIIQAMVDNPILIQRPIIISGNRAVIGRPPERVLEILG